MKIHNRIIEEVNKSISSRERKVVFAQQVLNAMPKGEPIRATEIALKIGEKDRFVTVQKVTATLKWLLNINLIEKKVYTYGDVPSYAVDYMVKLPFEWHTERHELFEHCSRYVAFIKQ